ncbi:hypothetical protein LTR27_007569 [Elasticomyces elasticus]|nr:hypothetical protein LTR27_007569 [Elasticomyces elasticus]
MSEKPAKSAPLYTPKPLVASPIQSNLDLTDTEKPALWRRTSTSLQAFTSRRHFTRRSQRTQAAYGEPLTVTGHQFSFRDLPRVHYIEERANETLSILQNNVEVLERLEADYKSVIASLDSSIDAPFRDAAMVKFVKIISDTQTKMKLQQTRVTKLLRLLSDRKSLLQGILSYESMEANRRLAEKASISAENMESLAHKTKLEAVSMRIITLVTLFFLPGTFISLTSEILKTLMSTPIVTFEPGSPSTSDRNVSAGALGFYVAVSLPLMVLTFLSWYAVYWWENRKERKRQLQMDQAVSA